MGTSTSGFTSSYWCCGKQLDDISILHIFLFIWMPSLVTWQRCQFSFAFADLILPVHRTMWGWSCPSLKANMAWIACYWDITITSIYNTAVYLESSPCSHLYNVSKTAALTRCVLKCHQVPHNAQELHHWLCMAALSASSTTAESLHGLPAETGPDRPWLLWCAPSWLEASLMLCKDVEALV